jgi:hypothetical protein
MPLRERCTNDNHGRMVVTVRFCGTCGVVVNDNIFAMGCPEDKHASMRRERSTYCVDCGERLIEPRWAR